MTLPRPVVDSSKVTDSESVAAALSLLSASAVRERCHWVLEAARSDGLTHFRVNLDALPACATLVANETRSNYPDLDVPYHSRWRHFETRAGDLTKTTLGKLVPGDLEYCRVAIDLSVISVLLDAGAGGAWRYRDETTQAQYERSEGLAVASLRMFDSGLFSSDPGQRHRVDSAALSRLDASQLQTGLQVTEGNPLPGINERVTLLNALGHVLSHQPPADVLERPADLVLNGIDGDTIRADELLSHVLRKLNSIWPQGLYYNDQPLGDVGCHPAAHQAQFASGLVPFHKLSQWLVYSLLEPLEWGGIVVTELDGLTGLAEYRNGGLLIDSGVILPVDPSLCDQPLALDSEPVVEWRALTVALLDELAPLVRNCLGVNAPAFPLARMLQGGTWSAGRRLAKEKRPNAAPPLTLKLTGTVF